MHRRIRSLLATLFILIAALPVMAQDPGEWYLGKTIKSIEFQGLKTVSRSEMDSLVKPYLGKSFQDDLFLELQGKVYDVDLFDSIEPKAIPGDKEGNSIIIRFEVVEKPVIDSVRFEGNSGIKTIDLLGVVVSKSGDMSSKLNIASDEDEIRKLYHEKGYPMAQVGSVERKTARGLVLVFVIDEGRQIVVKGVRVLGSQAFSEKTLKAVLPLKEQSLFNNGAYQEEKIEAGREALLKYYRDRGYVDASVSAPDVVQEADDKKKRNNATVSYTVSEGLQYLYTGVKFEGNVIFSTDKLAALFLQRTGQVFNYSKYRADMERVRNLYYENGYVFSQIESKEERNEEAKGISFIVQIVERDRAHISEIQVKGNTKTKDHVVLREFPIEPGDIFSKRKIEEGYRNLLGLQYFSSIFPEVIPVSEQIVDIILNVTEQSTAGFNFGVTYVPTTNSSTSKIPFGGFVKWNDSNFLGNGQNFAVSTEFTPDKQNLTFSFTESWLANQRWLGGVSLSFNHQQQTVAQDILSPVFTSGVPDPYNSYEEYKAANYSIPSEYMMTYDSLNFGAGLNTGYVFKMGLTDLGLRLGTSFTLENILYDDSKYRPYDPSIRSNHNNWQLSDNLTAYAYWNGLDNPVNPSKGAVLTNKFVLSGYTPFESQQYLREEIKLEAFLPLVTIPVVDAWRFRLILGGHSSYTALFPKPGIPLKVKTGNYPVVDGMMTMRGWSELVDFNATGIFYNWLELRTPLIEQYIWLDLFIDAVVIQTQEGLLQPISGGANVMSDRPNLLSMGADNFAFSVGGMLRLTIPQFPFKIGLAKKFVVNNGALQPASGELFKTADPLSGWSLIVSLSQSLF